MHCIILRHCKESVTASACKTETVWGGSGLDHQIAVVPARLKLHANGGIGQRTTSGQALALLGSSASSQS